MAYTDFDNKKDGVVPNGWTDNTDDGVVASDSDDAKWTQNVDLNSFGKNNPRPGGSGGHGGYALGNVPD